MKFSIPEFFETPFFKATHAFVFWNNEVKHVPDSPKTNGFQSHMIFAASVSLTCKDCFLY
jgi:hypothetical protein